MIFIGDSITDAGRDASAEPSPWLPNFGLGSGYVSQVWAWLTAAYPEARIRVFNKGTSGHTVRDLASRWQSDVLDLKPDVLSVMIGINDVWRQFDVPTRKEISVQSEEYRQRCQSRVLSPFST
jgi:lysophospholipase L1-like esterase